MFMKVTEYISKHQFLSLNILIWTVWTVLIICLIGINIKQQRVQSLNLAINTARSDLAKDKMFRLWATSHGGVYVPPTERTPPNPYLKNVPDQDIVTLKGKKLTLMNHAYILSQMMREYKGLYGSKGHITSLNAINPKNAPDAWEKTQLKLFSKKEQTEIYELQSLNGSDNLRMMKPLTTEKKCLKCHAHQGYKTGDIRGGVSITVPMLPIRKLEYEVIKKQIASFCSLWIIGLFFISFFVNKLKLIIKQRIQLQHISEKHELLEKYNDTIASQNDELKDAITKVKLLSGFIPICASCKKIRDDKGYWNQVEEYITKHSMAEFTHGLCPECVEVLYPDFKRKEENTK